MFLLHHIKPFIQILLCFKQGAKYLSDKIAWQSKEFCNSIWLRTHYKIKSVAVYQEFNYTAIWTAFNRLFSSTVSSVQRVIFKVRM